MNIQKLYFGKDDAETDYTSSGLLKDGFLKTSLFNRIDSGRKRLVIGRKGSGKSAVCIMLHNHLCQGAYSTIITPDAISADEIRRFELLGIDSQQSKKLVWRYIFLVSVCKFLLSVEKSKIKDEEKWRNGIKEIRKFLIENHEVDDLTFKENFWRIINRISAKLNLSAFGQGVELEADKAPNEGLRLNLKLDYLEKHLKNEFTNLKTDRFFLLIDQVDEIWGNDPSSNLMVIGLLLAMKEINVNFDSVNCVVFLRTDIYEQIQFFDKDKFRGDEDPIVWAKEDLVRLILARAALSTGDSGINAEKFKSEYFVARVDNIDTLQFLLSYTLMRPRDIIQLCNHCADLGRRDGANKVSEKHIKQAIEVYSGWKLNDLIGEYRINYPFLNELSILFSNTSYIFPRAKLETIYSRVKSSLEERYAQYKPILSLDGILNILYSIGFIGIEKMGQTVYFYDNPGSVEEQDKTFIVHPAFRSALKCASSIDAQPFVRNNVYDRHISEINRGKSAIRGEFEGLSRRSSYELEYLYERLQKLKKTIMNETEVSADVAVEMNKNLDEMILESEMVLKRGDYALVPSTVLNIRNYLFNLKDKLLQSGLIERKSYIFLEIEKAIELY